VRSVKGKPPEPDPAAGRPARPSGSRPADAAPDAVRAEAASDASQMITAVYGTQYCLLVRLAALLVGDVGAAEQVVQDSFVAMRDARRRLPDHDGALCYLRKSVVSRSRSVGHQPVARPTVTGRPPHGPAARQEPVTEPEQPALISALRSLPPRQREAIVLRFYLDLSEPEIASAMGVRRGAVTRHTARAMAAVSGVLQPGS